MDDFIKGLLKKTMSKNYTMHWKIQLLSTKSIHELTMKVGCHWYDFYNMNFGVK